MAEELHKMSQAERSTALRKSLASVSEAMNEIESHRDDYVTSRVEGSLLAKLNELDETCNGPTALLLKNRNMSIKSSVKAKDQFDALAAKNSSQAKLDRKKAELEQEERRVYVIDKNLQTSLLRYEKKRVSDMKEILEDLVKGQLLFHCRAVEAYTKALKSISRLDSDDAVEQLCRDLYISTDQVRLSAITRERDQSIANENPASGVR
mmetsp:Transcript_9766/g.22577  ORF Transcript_9766/g.22577 Transcript_9766/m.22577 type:complete len:208 (+) Transcript_9766:442-1065(+)